MKKIIIIGSNGFIGKELVGFLTKKDIKIIGIDVTHDIYNSNKLYTYIAINDLNDLVLNYSSYNDLFNNDLFKKVDAIYNLAWVGNTAKNKRDYNIQLKNIELSMKIMEFAKIINVSKVVVLGSTSQYSGENVFITGKTEYNAIDAYGATKTASHELCKQYAKDNNIKFIETIVASTYGKNRDIGDLISYVIKSLLKNEKPSVTKLEQYWSFVHIEDLVNALYLVGLKGESDIKYPICGPETPQKLYEYVKIIEKIIKSEIKIGIGDIPYKDGVPTNIFFNKSIMRELGFYNKYTFEEGIKEVIEDFREKLKYE